MKFSKLSSLVLGLTIAFGTTMPAEANILEILQQKRHHLQEQSRVHDRHHDGHHDSHHEADRYEPVHHSRVNHRRNRRYSRSGVRVFRHGRRHSRFRNWRRRH